MLDLIQEFEAITSLPDDMKLYILRQMKEEHYSKRKYLLKAGQVCRDLYFVRKGSVRGYFAYRGEDRTMRFARENELCLVPESFLKQIPSRENLQAIEESFVYALPYEYVQNICRLFPKFYAILNYYLTAQILEANNCLSMFRSLDGFHRFKWMADNYPVLIKTYPLKITSSYVGLSPTSVGRFIRRDTGESVVRFKKPSEA